ncbi:MAG: 1,4-alpha-glucan branching protein GlgB [Geminicoccaceae bacterium]|nr:1,4-alpha-glucan branching protein GlgB [Geminicoccaceae bacterium]
MATVETAGTFRPADPAAVEALVAGRHGDPFGILGPHEAADGWTVRVFLPDAVAVEVLVKGRPVAELKRTHDAGFFEGAVPGRGRPAYGLRVTWPGGDSGYQEDPYRFPPVLGDLDVHLMREGSHQKLFERMGAHTAVVDGVEGTVFAVWAPSASRVSVVGAFNFWDGRRHPMRRRVEAGIWELFLPGVGAGAAYKYEILGPQGEPLPQKADPFAFHAEMRPATASIVQDLPPPDGWGDAAWMAARERLQRTDAPISVYEVHLGSWKRGEGNRYLTYKEFASDLVGYARDMGFTHIELLPVNEHPFDGSWGYQPTGLYAPTSRFGDPEAFAAFVDACHEAEIGLLLDWVPGHFPTDPHGLGRFDGTALYEHADPRQGFHQDWNTLIYNFGRVEVLNFLVANALFWMERYHVDGLRVDAVASMLYLDYSRKADEWVPNRYGGRENLEAVDFLRRMNEEVYRHAPGVTTVAEESTAWPSVSRPVYLGGLGFGYKWNMGWMHDTLQYMQTEPVYRKYHQNQLTFGLLYAFSENFVLPLSHDEVVHGKGSLINKMPGDVWQKFANLRAYYGFMWTHPGKKLLFMGGEFGQWREWNHDQSLDWHLLDEGPFHKGLQGLVRDLNGAYRGLPALHELDCDPAGFSWIDASDTENSVLSYLRRDRNGGVVAVVSNFTPVPRQGYRLGLPKGGVWRERINTDAEVYGGSGQGNGGEVHAEDAPWHGQPASLTLTLPPLATLVLVPD